MDNKETLTILEKKTETYGKDLKELRTKINHLERILDLFIECGKDLQRFIDKHKQRSHGNYKDSPPEYLYISDTKIKNLSNKLLKLLFAYLSATYMLEQQTSMLIGGDRYNDNLWKNLRDYLDKNGERLFLFGLRNYITHTDLFPINISIRYSKNDNPNKVEGFSRTGIFEISRSKYQKHLETYDFSTNKEIDSPLIKQNNIEMHRNLVRYVNNIKGFNIDITEIISKHTETFSLLIRDILDHYYRKNPKIEELNLLIEEIRKIQFKLDKETSNKKY